MGEPGAEETRQKVEPTKTKPKKDVETHVAEAGGELDRAKKLAEEKRKLATSKMPSPDGEARKRDIGLSLTRFETRVVRPSRSLETRINAMLKPELPEDRKDLAERETRLAPWYLGPVRSDPGFGFEVGRIRGPARPDIGIKDQKAKVD